MAAWSSASATVSLSLSADAGVPEVSALASSVRMWSRRRASRARYTARAATKCHVFSGLL